MDGTLSLGKVELTHHFFRPKVAGQKKTACHVFHFFGEVSEGKVNWIEKLQDLVIQCSTHTHKFPSTRASVGNRLGASIPEYTPIETKQSAKLLLPCGEFAPCCHFCDGDSSDLYNTSEQQLKADKCKK